MPALHFAEQNLAPRAPTSPEFVRDLEETMAILVFPPGQIHPSLAHILEPGLRKDVAKRVNEAMLSSLGEDRRTRLYELVKTREWVEKKARDANRKLPFRMEIGLDSAETPYGSAAGLHPEHGNMGGGAMIL